MAHPQDYRRAPEPELLEAIGAGQPLALAEAYHRAVPAAHAVARRLMPGANEVEAILLRVFGQLWESPPTAVSLEGWVRRTTWAACADRLRTDGTAPASPSASGLLPDLPAPDVRFLDAAERAMAELDDDARRALLLAHDKGVPSTSQEDGAGDALVRALLALAGPEASSGDRGALDEDPCQDLPELGDWALGIADSMGEAAVNQAIEQRPGCAAIARAVRRGRRRIEGLPATPDMGQRVLVSVLTTSGRLTAATSAPSDTDLSSGPATADDGATTAVGTAAGGDDQQITSDLVPAPDATASTEAEAETGGVADTGPSDAVSSNDAVTDDVVDGVPVAANVTAADPDDPFAELDEDDPFAGMGDPSDSDLADDPFAAPPAGQAETADPLMDTADLPASSVAPDPPTAAQADQADSDWAPNPGDTAELRLSDILADDDPDDPFSGLDDEAPEVAGGSPYAALKELDGDDGGAAPSPFGVSDSVFDGPARADASLVDPATGVYVEGQDHADDGLDYEERGTNPLAAALAWILPVIGGLAIGVLLAVVVFGPPSA